MRYLLVLFCLFTVAAAFAQSLETTRCHTLEWESYRRKQNPALPSLQQLHESVNKKIKEKKQYSDLSGEKEDVYRIPVIVHIIHKGEPVGQGTNISRAQVVSQITALNEDFRRTNPDTTLTPDLFKTIAADTRIEFVLATTDTFGLPLPEPGIRRYNGNRSGTWNTTEFSLLVKPRTIWNPMRYYNIWVADLSPGSLGFAQFPDLSGLQGMKAQNGGADTDGTVVDYDNFGSIRKVDTPQLRLGAPWNTGRTLTHEIGHALGLIHIWGDKGDCQGNDYCEDTPQASVANYRCNGIKSSCGHVTMIQNYMDYSDDSCMNIFTRQQAERMRTVLETSPRRRELLFSTAAEPVKPGVYAYFEAGKTKTCPFQPIAFTAQSVLAGNAAITSYQWIFPGGTPATSQAKNPVVSYPNPGNYDVILVVRSNLNTDTIVRKDYISILATATPVQQVTEDFADFPVAGWQANGWEKVQLSAPYGAAMAGRSLSSAARVFELTAPVIATTGASLLEISFDMAYSPLQSSDSLSVLITTDCGSSYQRLYKQGGKTLGTAIPRPSFLPLPAEWKRITLYADVTQSQTAQVVFSNLAYYGSHLYLDNISFKTVQPPVPTADIHADRTLVLTGEKIRFRNRTPDYATSYQWTFPGMATSTDAEPEIAYATPGNYDVSLTAGNPAGQYTQTSRQLVKVVAGKMLDNTAHNPLVLPSQSSCRAIAEYFEGFGAYEELPGADVFFGRVSMSAADAEVTVKVWEALPDGAGKYVPGAELATGRLRADDIRRDLILNRASRVRFERSLVPPQRFFVGLEFAQTNTDTIEVYSASTAKNTGWEMTTAGKWQPYSQATAEGGKGVSIAHAIFPLMATEKPTALDDAALTRQLAVFPNPAHQTLHLKANGLQVSGCRLYNGAGQEIPVVFDAATAEIRLPELSNGIYLLTIYTDKGLATREVQVMQ